MINNDIVKNFIELKGKVSFSTGNAFKVVLNKLFNYLNDKDPLKITINDMEAFFNDVLDKQNIKITSKETYRTYLHAFFQYIQYHAGKNGVTFINPVPSKKFYEFNSDEEDIKKIEDEENLKIFTIQEIKDILNSTRKNRGLRDFIYLCLCCVTGARPSEIATIKLENINLKEYYFETGLIKDARKTTRRTKKAYLFFLPEKFVNSWLKYYISTLPEKQTFLFSGLNKQKPMHPQTPRYILRTLKKITNINFTYKYFRNTIISLRLKNLNCPLYVSNSLMNHVDHSIEARYYLKKSLNERRQDYIKFFPYSEIEYF